MNIRLNCLASVSSPPQAGQRSPCQVIGPETLLAGFAVDQRIGEILQMPARLPDPRVHEDAGVQAHHVVAAVGPCSATRPV